MFWMVANRVVAVRTATAMQRRGVGRWCVGVGRDAFLPESQGRKGKADYRCTHWPLRRCTCLALCASAFGACSSPRMQTQGHARSTTARSLGHTHSSPPPYPLTRARGSATNLFWKAEIPIFVVEPPLSRFRLSAATGYRILSGARVRGPLIRGRLSLRQMKLKIQDGY